MKTKVFLFFLSLFLIFIVISTVVVTGEYLKPGPLAETRQIVIEKGRGVSAIAARLQSESVIDNAFLFRAAARLSGRHKNLKAGEYEFTPGVSLREALDILSEGAVVQRRITVREGLTSWQVVKILKETPELTGEIVTVPPEGSLLPETYSFMRGDSRQAKLEEMSAAMDKTLEAAWAQREPDIYVTSKEQALALASVVEKETGVAGERARIAGVFENRLRRGMPLQSDPTVIYALTDGKTQDAGQGPLGRRLLRKDLEIDSPYNSYKYLGLPPGPICNPGVDSLRAVLNPEKHDFLYFVADGSGGHVFSRTLDEHNANAAKWRVIRKKAEQ